MLLNRLRRLLLPASAALATVVAAAADEAAAPQPTPEQVRFFETQVRPVLADNCFKCHGPEKQKAHLRLDSRAAALAGGDSGPAVVPGNLEESLLVAAISHADELLKMPPAQKLEPAKIAALTEWVKIGAPWPGPAEPPAPPAARKGALQITEKDRAHWAFQPVGRPRVPLLSKNAAAWAANPIDAFIAAGLEPAGLQPNPPAPRHVLIRRATFDLTGLPPTPEEVEAFVHDPSPTAHETLVDRLLNSPHHGEKWGRHWLDLVRFAETNSYERDNPKPNAWRYRDYVIRALNDDKPYDRFVREQLAGDELEGAGADGLIATGFYRLGIWDDEPTDRDQALFDGLDDIVATTAQVFLGLTVDCARCHDHKLDPIPQKDYYRLVAFFRNINHYRNGGPTDEVPLLVGDAERVAYEAQVRELEEQRSELQAGIDAFEHEFQERYRQVEGKTGTLSPRDLQTLIPDEGPRLLGAERTAAYERLRRELREVSRAKIPVEKALCITEPGPEAPDTYVLLRGNPHVLGEKVEPGFLSVLGTEPPAIPASASEARTCGRRRVLADWIAAAENPLTARVIANRVWQHHFGRGIVRSPNNFGLQGDRPTHPELLDWLAAELVAQGWRLKPLHRLIMTSNAYQMSSQGTPEALAKDPANDRFWRFDMRRLGAEEIRDAILATTGTLSPRMYGPGIYPEIPAEVMAGQSMPGKGWGKSAPAEQARRSIYVHVKRSLLLPILESFDVAETDRSSPVRFATTQPTQALGLLNSTFLNRQASLLAVRLRREAGLDAAAQVARAVQLATGRSPAEAEIRRGMALIAALKTNEGLGEPAALEAFCLVVLNLNEFIYMD
jgi:hypothetical protein